MSYKQKPLGDLKIVKTSLVTYKITLKSVSNNFSFLITEKNMFQKNLKNKNLNDLKIPAQTYYPYPKAHTKM